MSREMKTAEARKFYVEMLLRWLIVKRDYPWNNEPEPVSTHLPEWRLRRARTETIREFQREL